MVHLVSLKHYFFIFFPYSSWVHIDCKVRQATCSSHGDQACIRNRNFKSALFGHRRCNLLDSVALDIHSWREPMTHEILSKSQKCCHLAAWIHLIFSSLDRLLLSTQPTTYSRIIDCLFLQIQSLCLLARLASLHIRSVDAYSWHANLQIPNCWMIRCWPSQANIDWYDFDSRWEVEIWVRQGMGFSTYLRQCRFGRSWLIQAWKMYISVLVHALDTS